MSSVEEIINTYERVVKVVDKDAKEQEDRAYGGVIRTVKGKLQEYITEELVKIAWDRLGGNTSRLEINSKKIKIPIKQEYIDTIPNENIKHYIQTNISDYYYGLSVDKHVFIDNNFVMGIECKAYTENAMLKRILVDFHLLKTIYPDISCNLFQLESQLGGDYSSLPETIYGSHSTHSIMSYFPNVNLNIFTFLKGERNIDEPIHKHFKELKKEVLEKVINHISNVLNKYK